MPPTLSTWAFVLAVPDLDASAGYFRDVLGFELLWPEATDWRLVQRDNVRVMLGHCPTDAPPTTLGSHNLFGYVNVNDIDALHAEIAARGALCTPPADRPYGMREIVVTTIDGHRILFGQAIGGGVG
ncbi:VOC family protein [Methylosinus sp. LW4]|uniref:VOC family protein n=1 Tax=Methylosinus sp. LW4 TaxID=136993 RepID=UPI0003724D79|nr:VOC family protein [Methylosinus sp. LW4]